MCTVGFGGKRTSYVETLKVLENRKGRHGYHEMKKERAGTIIHSCIHITRYPTPQPPMPLPYHRLLVGLRHSTRLWPFGLDTSGPTQP
jgi:hypothetical protein